MAAYMVRVAGVVLAGGLSRRMGSDKALLELAGKPLIQHAIERLAAQCEPLAVNANGDASRLARLGLPVIADATGDYAGPLAGILAGLRWAQQAAPDAPFLMTAACDTPFLPADLVTKFLEAAEEVAYPAIILAQSGGQVHPVSGLWPTVLAGDLAEALESGTRGVWQWARRHSHRIVDVPMIDLGAKQADPFFNANTPGQLAEAEALAKFLAPVKLC